MAMPKCGECGNQVSSKAKTCPSCGAPVVVPVSPVTSLVTAVIALLVVLWFFSAGGKKTPPVAEPAAV
jgi:uncharacterized OB-fold protein